MRVLEYAIIFGAMAFVIISVTTIIANHLSETIAEISCNASATTCIIPIDQ